MFETIITTSAEQAGELHRDREHAHTAVLSLWHHRTHSTTRATVGAVWAVTEADMLTDTGKVLVRSTVPPERTPAWAQNLATTDRFDHAPAAGEPVRLTLEIEAGRTPHVPVSRDIERALKQGADGTPRAPGKGLAFRARREAVPTGELPDWAVSKLARHGIDTHAVSVLRTGRVQLPRHQTAHPLATLSISGVVSDAEAYRQALRQGIGKGKSFGLGLVIEHPVATT